MAERLAAFVMRRRIPVMAATLLLVSVCGAGMRHLVFDNDYRVWFSPDNPQLRAFESLQDTYTEYDNVLFVLAPGSGDVFDRRVLEAVQWLTDEAWQVPYSIRVDSITNFQHSRADGDDLVVSDLVEDPGSLSDADLARIRETALAEPALRNRYISASGHVTGVDVTVSPPGKRTDLETPEIVGFVRELAGQFRERYPDIELYMTGVVMMENAFPEASERDMRTLIPAMFAIVVVVLIFMSRSIAGAAGTVLVIAFTIITTMGVMGWAGIRITGATSAVPIIVLTLAVADCVHVLTNFLHGLRNGETAPGAMTHSLRINLQPVFITSATTAIGFLSMNFGEVPPFWHLGNLVAVGVGCAFVYSVTFFPAFLLTFPVKAGKPMILRTSVMERLADWIVRRRRGLLYGLGPVMLVIVAFIPRNELNDEFVKYFDQSVEFRRHTDYTTDNLTGIYSIHFSLPSGESGGIADPAYLRAVERFTAWLRGQPEVIHVSSITDTLKRLNRNLHGDDPAEYRLPASRDLAAQYLLLYELSLPYGLDLNNRIDIDKSATHLVAFLESVPSQQHLALEARAGRWLKENAPAPMQSASGSSPNLMFAHISERNVKSMFVGIAAALAAISLILVVVLRSVSIGLVSMIPNLLPAALTLGIWGLLVGRIGLPASVVAAISLGIIVDDTVHFLSKYLYARRERGLEPAGAIRYAFTTVGMALLITSVVLVAGFLALVPSSFEVNATLGLLTAITIGLALFTDFFLLPPLLMTVDRGGDRE